MPAPSPLQVRFGIAIRTLRAAQGISQEELAHRSGVARTYIGELERGRRCPTICTAEDVARAFGMEVDELLRAARDISAFLRGSAG
jgi:XRE family transcriptional regulator, regulator of sulfur utilization